MKPTYSFCGRLAVVVGSCVWLLAVPAAAQRRNPEATGREPAAPAPKAQAVPRESKPSAPADTRGTGDDQTSSGAAGGRSDRTPAGSGTSTGRGDTTGSRPRDGQPAIGEAVPRKDPPPRGGRDTVIIPGYYGGYGYGGYGGYYGGYYDPYGYPDPYGVYGQRYAEGALKLKVRPQAAMVYVDGYYTGIVDDFDGFFQRLRVEAGPHRIEVRAPGFESLTFDVRIEPGRTTTYHGELKRIP